MPIDVNWAYNSSDRTPSGSELALKQILAGQPAQPIIIYFEAATLQFTPPASDGKADSWCPDCAQNAGLPFAVAAEQHRGELFVTFLERQPTYENLVRLLERAASRQ